MQGLIVERVACKLRTRFGNETMLKQLMKLIPTVWKIKPVYCIFRNSLKNMFLHSLWFLRYVMWNIKYCFCCDTSFLLILPVSQRFHFRRHEWRSAFNQLVGWFKLNETRKKLWNFVAVSFFWIFKSSCFLNIHYSASKFGWKATCRLHSGKIRRSYFVIWKISHTHKTALLQQNK